MSMKKIVKWFVDKINGLFQNQCIRCGGKNIAIDTYPNKITHRCKDCGFVHEYPSNQAGW